MPVVSGEGSSLHDATESAECQVNTKLVHARGGPGYDLLLGVTDARNTRSVKLTIANGYRVIGRRWNLIYMLRPFNALGFFLYVAFRSVFPFLKILDRIQGDGS